MTGQSLVIAGRRLFFGGVFPCGVFFTITINANNKKTPSTLNEVTVYLNGAQITRTAQIVVSNGTTEFVFNNLSPNIQENSIQISGLNNATILSINYGINY